MDYAQENINMVKLIWIFIIWVSLFKFEFKYWFSLFNVITWFLIQCNNYIAGFRIAKWYSDNFISPPNYYLSPEKWNKLLDDLGIRAFISTSPCSFDMEVYTPTNPQRWNSGNSHFYVDYINKAKSIFVSQQMNIYWFSASVYLQVIWSVLKRFP